MTQPEALPVQNTDRETCEHFVPSSLPCEQCEITPRNRVLGRRLLSIAGAIRVGECARGEAEVVVEAAFALLGHASEAELPYLSPAEQRAL